MTAFHIMAIPHEDTLTGREEVGKVGQQGRLL